MLRWIYAHTNGATVHAFSLVRDLFQQSPVAIVIVLGMEIAVLFAAAAAGSKSLLWNTICYLADCA